MSAIERAEQDERAGDFGTAKRRLRSYMASVGYAPELCQRLARLSIRMGDPVEAGRWYFLCDSADVEAPAAIARFVRSCGGHPAHMLSQLPAVARLPSVDAYPAAVRERLESHGYTGPPAAPPMKKPNFADTLFGLGCALACLSALLVFLIGFWVSARWAFSHF